MLAFSGVLRANASSGRGAAASRGVLVGLATAAVLLGGVWGATAFRSTVYGDEKPVPDTQETKQEPLRTPAEALKLLQVPAGFRTSLFASEPLVRQPIGITTDARGRVWIAENYTYAERGTNFDTKLFDRIVILEDRDQDGQAETRTVFWDQASKLTSVELGYGGVWALCPPQLLFLPDRNGDDQPDGPPEVVLDGFDHEAIRHNIANGLKWGPDGWLYGRHGILATSELGRPGLAREDRVRINTGLWRYHPRDKRVEAVAHGTTNPWGHDWDENGQLFFINTVIGHLWHVVPGAHYERMFGDHFRPHLYKFIPQTADHFHWDTVEKWSDIRQKGVTPTTDQAGGGHAHSGMIIHPGIGWPAAYKGRVFTVNLHGRRLNCDKLERDGAGYQGRHEADFLKSGDPWFRAVELTYGPDGSLYVADWSDIGECHENDGVHRNSGRIFRVTYGTPEKSHTFNLRTNSHTALLAHALSTNEWYARQARLVLGERAAAGADLSAVVKFLVSQVKTDGPHSKRLRALWLLHTLGATTEELLLPLLDDDNEHLRTWGLQCLVERSPVLHPARGSDSEQVRMSSAFRSALQTKAKGDPSGLVLLFTAAALQKMPVAERWAIAGALAQRGEFASDPVLPLMLWYGIEGACLSSPEEAAALARDTKIPLIRQFIARRLASGLDQAPEGVAKLVSHVIEKPELAVDVSKGLSDGLRGWRKAPTPPRWNEFVAAAQTAAAPAPELVRELSVVFGDGRALDELRKLAGSNQNDLNARRRALAFLIESRAENLVPLLQKLLGERDIAVDAVKGLAAFNHPDTPRLLVENFPRLGTAGQREAVSTLTSRKAFAPALLEAVSQNKIARHFVSVAHIRQMYNFEAAEIDQRLLELWPELRKVTPQKQERIAALSQALTKEVLSQGNKSAGRALFAQTCAKCHKLYGEGGTVSPDLTGAQRSNLAYLLENIVDPSATLAANFRVTIYSLKDGRTVSGVAVEKSEKTLTIQTATDKLTVNKQEIEEQKESKVSLMPEGLLDVLKPEQVRDLIAYLMSPEQVPLPVTATITGERGQ